MVDVRREGLCESSGRLCVGCGVFVVDDHAIEEGERFAEDYGNDDEGQEEEEVGASHDEEAEVGLGVEDGDAD